MIMPMQALRPTIQQALATLPPLVYEGMLQICPNFNASISKEAFASLMSYCQLSDLELRLALLPIAAAYALPSISEFYVGAIARGGSGQLYFGANMEFSNCGLNNSVHAEQSAITHAWSKGEQYLTDITINYSPCGHCRQFMNELNQIENTKIQLPNQPAQQLNFYLPNAFGPKDLNVTARLLSRVNHGFLNNTNNALLNIAIQALNQSYAPYSHSYSAVALACKNGEIYAGRYAENAAFNPSLAPLQMALNIMNLADVNPNQITKGILLESKKTNISHLENTKAMLNSINTKIDFDYVTV